MKAVLLGILILSSWSSSAVDLAASFNEGGRVCNDLPKMAKKVSFFLKDESVVCNLNPKAADLFPPVSPAFPEEAVKSQIKDYCSFNAVFRLCFVCNVLRKFEKTKAYKMCDRYLVFGRKKNRTDDRARFEKTLAVMNGKIPDTSVPANAAPPAATQSPSSTEKTQ